MTKQEELEHLNRIIQDKLDCDWVEDVCSQALPHCLVPKDENKVLPCLTPIQSEFESILHSTQPSLVIVPSSFFSYQQQPQSIQPVVSKPKEESLPCCSCGGNNNCVSTVRLFQRGISVHSMVATIRRFARVI